MTDDTSTKDDPFAMDESPAHRFIAGRTGTGKTDRLTAVMAAFNAESTPEWIDSKADDEDVTDRSES
ncbi:hypothetical protein [Halococcus sediminicola]|uniref:hypothetical protein n=1 Tax=Halococcus sediminicola TaxID=1264579 RepID=UPI000A8B7C5C|nr:hypothetical protein [Halococcus sediminicola]